MENYTNTVLTDDKNVVDQLFNRLDTLYTSGVPEIEDTFYDRLIDMYTKRFGPRFVVGAPVTESAVLLPIAMMSLDKVMSDKEITNWVKKNPGPYVAMDKINGNPGLYVITHTSQGQSVRLLKRGNGTEGPDISRLLPNLNLPVLPFDVYIKGELVIDKDDHAPYKGDGDDQYKTNLSMVTGLTNTNNKNPNIEHLKLIKFIAFDMAFPNNQNIELNMTQTMDHLTKYGFKTPFRISTPALTEDWLSKLYNIQKQRQTYDVDGIVIVADRPIKYSERMIRENPKYAIAFKEYGDIYETTVTNVVWEASKHGFIKPVVHVEHTKVGDTGFTIRKATGFNAKWIVDNNVGIGATIQVVHNTIPYIIGVIEGTEPLMPSSEKYPEWEWNDTKVDIILVNMDDHYEVKIARIYEFFKKIKAKYWGETTLEKFYNAGFDTIKKMVETTREEFMAANIDGIGSGIVDRMVKTLESALSQTNLSTLMAGSGSFGHGIGERMIEVVLETYPNILDLNPSLEEIMALDGFAEKKAQKFVDGLPKFKSFIRNIPILEKVALGKMKPILTPEKVKPGKASAIEGVGAATGQSLDGVLVVFTGFRDKQLEEIIKSGGGQVKTGVTKKVNYVIVDGPKGKGSSKEVKAIKYGISTPNIAEFKGMFGL